MLESDLYDLLMLHDAKVCKEIDAGACRTDYDYRQARKADDAYQEAHERFISRYGETPSSVEMTDEQRYALWQHTCDAQLTAWESWQEAKVALQKAEAAWHSATALERLLKSILGITSPSDEGEA